MNDCDAFPATIDDTAAAAAFTTTTTMLMMRTTNVNSIVTYPSDDENDCDIVDAKSFLQDLDHELDALSSQDLENAKTKNRILMAERHTQMELIGWLTRTVMDLKGEEENDSKRKRDDDTDLFMNDNSEGLCIESLQKRQCLQTKEEDKEDQTVPDLIEVVNHNTPLASGTNQSNDVPIHVRHHACIALSSKEEQLRQLEKQNAHLEQENTDLVSQVEALEREKLMHEPWKTFSSYSGFTMTRAQFMELTGNSLEEVLAQEEEEDDDDNDALDDDHEHSGGFVREHYDDEEDDEYRRLREMEYQHNYDENI